MSVPVGTLRSGGAELAPLLIREAGRIFPGLLDALDAWVPPWRAQPEPEAGPAAADPDAGQGLALLAAYPATGDALEALLRHTNSTGPVSRRA